MPLAWTIHRMVLSPHFGDPEERCFEDADPSRMIAGVRLIGAKRPIVQTSCLYPNMRII
jgi:hypothetical protein